MAISHIFHSLESCLFFDKLTVLESILLNLDVINVT